MSIEVELNQYDPVGYSAIFVIVDDMTDFKMQPDDPETAWERELLINEAIRYTNGKTEFFGEAVTVGELEDWLIAYLTGYKKALEDNGLKPWTAAAS